MGLGCERVGPKIIWHGFVVRWDSLGLVWFWHGFWMV